MKFNKMANKNLYSALILLMLFSWNPLEISGATYSNELTYTTPCDPVEDLTVHQSPTDLDINWFDPTYTGMEEYQITIYVNGAPVLVDYTMGFSYAVSISTLGLNIGDHVAVEVIKICPDGTMSPPTIIEGDVCPPEEFKLPNTTPTPTLQRKDRPRFGCIIALEGDLPFGDPNQVLGFNEQFFAVEIKTTPNPSFGPTKIEVINQSGASLESIAVIHMISGKAVVYEKLSTLKGATYAKQLDLSNAAAGLYQVVVRTNSGKIFYSKLVLQK